MTNTLIWFTKILLICCLSKHICYTNRGTGAFLIDGVDFLMGTSAITNSSCPKHGPAIFQFVISFTLSSTMFTKANGYHFVWIKSCFQRIKRMSDACLKSSHIYPSHFCFNRYFLILYTIIFVLKHSTYFKQLYASLKKIKLISLHYDQNIYMWHALGTIWNNLLFYVILFLKSGFCDVAIFLLLLV